MKRIPLVTVIVLVAALSGIAESLTDSRDGRRYKVVEIDGTSWMAENLNFKTKNSFCYDDDESNCKLYGRLYTFDAAQNACPDGWRIASESDWNSLSDADYQKTLQVQPAGFRNSKGKYELEGLRADFWTDGSASKDKGNYAYFSFKAQKSDKNNYSKKGAMSVRCVQGEECDWEQMEGREFYESIIEKSDFSVWQYALHHICGHSPSNDDFLIIHKKSFKLKCNCTKEDDPYLDDGGGYPKFCGASGEKCNVCSVKSLGEIKKCLPSLNPKFKKNGYLTE